LTDSGIFIANVQISLFLKILIKSMKMLKTEFNPFPILTSDRLILRAVQAEDAQAVFEMRSDPRVMEYIDRPLATSIEDGQKKVKAIQDMVAANDAINWAITLRGNPQSIGNIGFWRFSRADFRIEIGYMLHPDHFRKGIMSEAMQMTLEYAFEEMNTNSIEARISPSNIPSIGVAEKNGFVKEAHFRENYYFDGKFLDTLVYCMLRSDWKKLKAI
jgi:ribosomal-protein-alanine N-acetyltransferase